MAIVQNIREKVHLPIYDSIAIEPGKQLKQVESSGTLKLFVNVQGKTKLETNLQAASLLPHYNTFEARAMRVVISDLPPEFSDEKDVTLIGEDEAENEVKFKVSVKRAMELLSEANENEEDGVATLSVVDGREADDDDENPTEVTIEAAPIEDALTDDADGPSAEQVRHNGNGVGAAFMSNFIFNTVTSLYVGEKLMIEMPTWFFPGGAGIYSETGSSATHGEPTPTATFRFAEPIFIDRQQNFRVEIEIPDSDVLKNLQRTYGPLFIWVVLDGYMTRGVQ
jgi:hypothetical protein